MARGGGIGAAPKVRRENAFGLVRDAYPLSSVVPTYSTAGRPKVHEPRADVLGKVASPRPRPLPARRLLVDVPLEERAIRGTESCWWRWRLCNRTGGHASLLPVVRLTPQGPRPSRREDTTSPARLLAEACIMGRVTPKQTATDDHTLFLTRPCYTRDQVFTKPCPVRKVPGVYAWWFRTIPGSIDDARCEQRDGLTLLYTGISPTRPFTNGKPPSSQNLNRRIKYHYSGNAEGSTLRKTLGVVLAGQLGIELRRVGSGKRRTFGTAGEAVLSRWMAENALVSWVEHNEPSTLEEKLIATLDVPLNLQGNAHNGFYRELKRLRAEAKRTPVTCRC